MSGRIMRLANARLRMSVAFDSTCDVLRADVEVYTQIPCMVLATKDTSQRIGGDTLPLGSFSVQVPVNYVLMEGDVVIERERRLQIISVTSPTSYEVRHEAFAIMIGAVE
jgi:hypothetical protein